MNWTDPLAGYKTYIAAAIAALVAANAVLHVVSQETQDALLACAAALGFWGIRAAMDRDEKPTTPPPTRLNQWIEKQAPRHDA